MSDVAPVVTAEPIRIVPTPKPIESAKPYQRYEGILSDLEVGLFDDAVDLKWDSHTLLEAALIAGGVRNADKLTECTAQFERLADQAADSINEDAVHETLARKLFEFMHRRILVGGYDLECTDLATTLEKGQYNCVSSTVLFNCLATRFGLEPVGIELPGHAMSRVCLDGENVDVETTCAAWFRLQHDPKRRAALIAKTIGVGLQTSETRPGREVSPVELVAMIYYNRGVDLLTMQRFTEAAAANAKALRLDPSSETAQGNLLATLNNWAITVGATQKFEQAIDLLQQGLRLDPHYETFAANYVHLYYQWSESLCAQDDFEAALEVLGQADTSLLGPDRLAQLRLEVYRHWARRMFQQGKSHQALQLLRTAETECQPLAGLYQQVEAQMLAETAAVLEQQNRHSEAAILLDWGLGRQPDSELLNERREALVSAAAH
jgi:tetratricopeptide (TPR) repeat protein